MPRLIPLVGVTSGRLTVLRRAPRSGVSRNSRWECQCTCGTIVSVNGQNLRNGHTKSCGCLQREVVTVHGHAKVATPEYKAWENMLNRCRCASMPNFHRYGGRGIRVCDEWRHDFLAFYRAVGPRPTPKHSIDRIDNNGHYEPGNVHWATKHAQNVNRNFTRTITVYGDTMAVSDAAVKYGVKYTTVLSRLQRGKTPEQAVQPPRW